VTWTAIPRASLLALLLLITHASHADESTGSFAGRAIADVSWEVGSSPMRCFRAPGEGGYADACVWRIYRRLVSWPALSSRFDEHGDAFHLICALDRGGRTPTIAACETADATQVARLHDHPGAAAKPRVDTTEQQRRKASRKVAAARTISEMVRLVGDVPDDCDRSVQGEWVCQWTLLTITPGYRTIANYYDSLTDDLRLPKKLRMVCRFANAVTANGPDCRISLLD